VTTTRGGSAGGFGKGNNTGSGDQRQLARKRLAGAPGAGQRQLIDLSGLTFNWSRQKRLRSGNQQPDALLTTDGKGIPAALIWLLKGHAAQRVIAAWHFGWEPAQQTSGEDWLAPFVAQLLTDDYGPVRYVAARSLRTLPGFDDFKTDFLGSRRLLETNRRTALARWEAGAKARPTNGPLFAPAGGLDTNRIARLLSEQDSRPVTIQE